MSALIKRIMVVALAFVTSGAFAQNDIEWDGSYQLQLSDFRSSSTQIGDVKIYSLQSGSGMDFSFYMSNTEFMFTKNFNSKVNCTFKRSAASLVAPDTLTAMDLLSFARYEFDLSELYARKFRKKLFDGKGAFSSISFLQPIYNQVQTEFTDRHTVAAKETDIGRNKERLKELHGEVLREIQELPDFCKACKPPKKKK